MENVVEVDEVVNCPVCDSKKFSAISEVSVKGSGVYLRKSICESCKSIFSNIRPSIDWSMKNLYNHQDQDVVDIDIASPLEQRRIRRYQNIGNFLSEYTDTKEILDIGSGTGIGLIGFLNAGFKVAGLEPDGRSDALKDHSDVEIIGVTVEDFLKDFPAKRPNVSIIHVLEHIYEPSKIIAALSLVVDQGGLLYIEVPDVLNFRFSDHGHLAHCTYFNFESLSLLCAKFGFSPIARLYPKTQHYGDVHLGVLFRNDGVNDDMTGLGSGKKSLDWYRLAPATNIRGKYIKIQTNEVATSIIDYHNYAVSSEPGTTVFSQRKAARTSLSVLFSKFLNSPRDFLRMLKGKGLSRFKSDSGFDQFKHSKL